MSNKYEEQLLEAIQLMVDSAVENAGYDRTIQATVVECTDATIGKYKLKYQDAYIYAYATSTTVKYGKNKVVYVLVPANDMERDKTIIGLRDKLGADYAAAAEGTEAYEVVGNNCIETLDAGQIGLRSYVKADEVTIYTYQENDEINKRMKEYLTQSSSLIIGAKFQTNLPIEQQTKGDYGLAFELVFRNNVTGDEVVRTYLLNTLEMVGQPYLFKNPTEQTTVFNIDGSNFIRLNNIKAISYNFPKAKNLEEWETAPEPDIFISDLTLTGANLLQADETNGISISLITKQGTFFDEHEEDTKTIEAQVRVKGKLMTENSQQVQYYWFKENAEIALDSEKYHYAGGLGWECLNLYNPIEEGNVEWVPGKKEYVVDRSQCPTKETRFKCVVNYGGSIYSKIITIKNYGYDYNIVITSAGGTSFVNNNGSPILTCNVLDREGNKLEDTRDFTFSWKYYDLANNVYYPGSEAEGKIYRNFPVDQIKSLVTVKCSVFDENQSYMGTGVIILTNSSTIEGNYSLSIKNGEQVFLYDEAGIAPNYTGLRDQVPVLPLSFTLYDNMGNLFTEEMMKECTIEWWVPNTRSLLKGPADAAFQVKTEGEYDIYTASDALEFNFDIRSSYNQKSQNNTIILKIQYKDEVNLSAVTNFTFTKQGDVGTNGTKYVLKIVPNTNDINPPKYPVYYFKNGTKEGWNFEVRNQEFPFKLELYDGSEEPIFEAWNHSNLKWEILKSSGDVVGFTFGQNAYTFEPIGFTNLNQANSAMILKATLTYNSKKYYATLPIAAINYLTDKLELDLDSGFRYVKYTSDGTRPEYNDSLGYYPFEVNVVGKDFSEYSFNYSCLGSNLSIRNRECEDNQKHIKPVDSYVDNVVTDKVICNVTDMGTVIIPIHLYLDRYGIAAINDWDGNSVSIKEGGDTILAPQVGAGSKNTSNQFTGVVMGTVKSSSNVDNGLFGYYNGARTIFLDAETGKAEFGAGNGKIILDPSSNKAQLYSNNYSSGAGMMIDLSTPEIKFGSGNFKVDANGYLTAKGGGSIGGWAIGDDMLYYNAGTTGAGLIGTNGHANIAIYAGATNAGIGGAPFRVTHSGELTATKGTIGGWNIGSTQLTGGSMYLNNDGSLGGPNWSINSGGYATFSNVHINNAGGSTSMNWGNFQVNTAGNLTASNAAFTGAIRSGSTISGSTISGSHITGSSIDIGSSAYYLRMGADGTANPEVSGLNVKANGIQMNGNGIENIGSLHCISGETGQTTKTISITTLLGKIVKFRFTNGLLIAYEA